MALTPKSAAVFLIDCSASMGRLRDINETDGQDARIRRRSALDVMCEYVKAKIVQRIVRDLKTIPASVILYGYPKTKNILTTRQKEEAAERGETFDRKEDLYRGFYELLPLTFAFDKTLVERVDEARAGLGGDGDLLSAIILGLETLDAQPLIKTYKTKEIYILTDGESETNWDGWERTAQQLNIKGMSVKVVGMNFDDEQIGFVEKSKPETKRVNEQHLQQIVDRLDTQPSFVANALLAIESIATPQIRSVDSRADRMTLKLGDPSSHPDRALTLYIEVKKAVVPAAPQSMKKMSMTGFERVQAFASQTQSQQNRGTKRAPEDRDDDKVADGHDTQDDGDIQDGEEGETRVLSREEKERADKLEAERLAARFKEQTRREQRAQMRAGQDLSMGNIGADLDKTLRDAGLAVSDALDADLASHSVSMEKRYYYRPVPKPEDPLDNGKVKSKKKRAGNESVEEGESDDENDREIQDPTVLVDAHYYGGSLIPVGDLEDDVGVLSGLQTGMEIVAFTKQADVRYDWRMGDVFYVYAAAGQTGSEKVFSALTNGMNEKKCCAVVRFVKKGFTSFKSGLVRTPDPQIGILFPAFTDDAEYCYWIRMPFSEDIRPFDFPSLENLFNRKHVHLEKHPHLPTSAMDEAMDNFVDAMDLSTAGTLDAAGEPTPWFNIEESFSPAVHNIQNTLVFRMSNPDAELPPAPKVITKYMDPPVGVLARADEARRAVIAAFSPKLVPPKPKKFNKATTNFAGIGTEEEEKVERDRLFSKPAAVEAGNENVGRTTDAGTALSKQEQPMGEDKDDVEDAEPDTDEDEPETEDEEDDVVVVGRGEPIGSRVEKARKLVEQSFSTQSYQKASDELRKARKEAVEHGAASAYNDALRSFVDAVRLKKSDYLARLRSEGLGLLDAGGVPAAEAEAFLESF
ncbi:hypothetical protein JCM21900_004229 [Sporobolomyces salmonicolor]